MISSKALERILEAERARFAEERAAWQEERRSLLNRIQAPEVAAYEASGEPSEEPLYVPYDDDEAHNDYVRERLTGKVN